MLFLHGFPDQSIEAFVGIAGEGAGAAGEGPGTGPGSSFGLRRMPRAVEEKALQLGLNFCTFNVNGTPGSGASFFGKTLSGELRDIVDVLRWLRTEHDIQHFHVVGLSTGALLALMIERELKLSGIDAEFELKSITTVAACGADLKRALEFDFDAVQREQITEMGYCRKGFWLSSVDVAAHGPAWLESFLALPDTISPGDGVRETLATMAAQPNGDASTAASSKCYNLPLSSEYVKDFEERVAFIGEDVKQPEGAPLLLIHGREDRNIPFSEAEALSDLALGGGRAVKLLDIKKGNHLLTSSKDLKKAVNEMGEAWGAAYVG